MQKKMYKNITSFAKEVKKNTFLANIGINLGCYLTIVSPTQDVPSHDNGLFRYLELLAKGGRVLGSVVLSVCLFVDNITQKVMNGLE